MQEKIRDSYKNIKMAETSKRRIQENILSMSSEKKAERKSHRQVWKMGVAACLAFAVVGPTAVFAAGKVANYFESAVQKNGNQVKMQFSKNDATQISDVSKKSSTPEKYVKLSADFGQEYKLEKYSEQKNISAKQSAFQEYTYKDASVEGKDFWFELVYLDKDKALSTFDNEASEQVTVNGRKAVYCKLNQIVGSRYTSDYDTDYGQVCYVFLEDYGYLLRIAGQNKLGKDGILKIAEKIQVEEATAQDATKYMLFSKMDPTAWEMQGEESKKEINTKCYATDGTCSVDGAKAKVTDVQILDSLDGLDKTYLNNKNYVDQDQLFDKNGKLKTYMRETLQYGDGINSPEKKVVKTEKVQPKLVYVTLEFDGAKDITGEHSYQAPSLQLVTKQGNKIYESVDAYNRPAYIQNAFMDHMPCYFEETLGGKQFWMTKIKDGKVTMHVAYLVDEDLVDGMALCMNDWADSTKTPVYIDISK
jgi:hypothetical protein